MSILYTDGGVIDKNPSPIGGTWAYVLIDNDNEIELWSGYGTVSAERMGCPVTNNQMEFYAIVRGLLGCIHANVKEVRSDSNVSLGRFFRGWGITNIPDWMMEEYRNMLGAYKCKPWTKILKIKYTLLDGHPTKAQLAVGIGKRGHPVSKWNVLCDQMCNEAARMYKEMMK